MKKYLIATAILIFCVEPMSAFSANQPIIQSGRYDVSVEFAGSNMTTQACYKDADVKDLRSVVLTLEEPLMRKNCIVKILSESGHNAEWQMECKNEFVSRTTVGSIAWESTQYTGKFVRTMGKIKMESTIDAKRVDDCK